MSTQRTTSSNGRGGGARRSPALKVVSSGGKKPKPNALKLHIKDLNMTPLQRYVAIQRERGRMWAIGKVDVDVEQMVERAFLCDRHRCIQWTPHEDKADAEPLIDRSCCSRYQVPVMDLDRQKLVEILPLVKKRLDPDHPLVVDADEPLFDVDDEYQFVMREQGENVCQFVLYENGRTTCAIHKTCLEEGLPVHEYKPVGCSLWPVALIDWEDEGGEERYLLTTYVKATAGLFESGGDEEDDHENHFACLVDNNPAYDPMYKSVEGILGYTLGLEFYRQLDARAQKHLKERSGGGRRRA
jgi:hypothetical protein